MNLGAKVRVIGAAVFLALSALSQACLAQSIQLSSERFAAPQSLPFAAAPPPKPVPPPAPPKPRFVLTRDAPIHTELQAWAKSQDWELLWHPSVSWRVFRDADLSSASDVTEAVAEVIEILREEGKPVRLKISDGNRVMEVFYSNEARK